MIYSGVASSSAPWSPTDLLRQPPLATMPTPAPVLAFFSPYLPWAGPSGTPSTFVSPYLSFAREGGGGLCHGPLDGECGGWWLEVENIERLNATPTH